MRFVVFPRDAAPPSDIGGKAAGLAEAERAGLPVPRWFALRSGAFTASLDAAAREALAGADEAAIRRAVAGVVPAQEVRDELAAGLASLCPGGERVAVRSSATEEDSVAHSFAGQLESFLAVAPGDVEARVGDVWRSAFATRVLAYRRGRGLPAAPPPPAVLVQCMVDARVAGVAFSADPVTGRRGVAVVSGLAGLGTALVSGDADADTWKVDRRGRIVERAIVAKRRRDRPGDAGAAGVATVEVPPGEASRPALGDEEVRAVADLARRAARHFGRPQDIEWAYDGDRLLLLQTRPITSLTALADPDGVPAIWDNSNIVESYSGVTTPLTFSFASEVYEHVYRQFCRMMRVPRRRVAVHDDVFRNMLGLIRGRLYYNLLNWYRLLALLPGYRLNRRFMEQMMGVREPLPDALAAEVGRSASTGRLADAAHAASTVAGLVLSHLALERRVAAFTRRLDAALAPPDPPLADRRPDELAAHYRDLRGRLLHRWDAPLVNDFFAMIFYGLLRRLVQRWTDDAGGTLQNDLIGGTGGIVSAEPAVRMRELAALAAASPDLARRLATAPLGEIREAMAAAPAFRDAFDAYLDRFGERSVNELKLESLTLHDDPLPFLRAVGRLAARQQETPGGGAAGPAAGGDARRAAAEARVGAALRWRPLRRLAFAWVLRHARARVRDRENLRLERTRLFGRVRRVFLELGRRFHELDLLDDPRDVFFLEVDEVLAFVEGRSTCTDLRGLAAVRRRDVETHAAAPPPDDRFETRGLVYQGHAFGRTSARETAEAGDTRQGLGCCPGVVRGPVRVVADPRVANLEHRAILVAEHTDPGWIVVFPSAIGLLVERGSLLSHAAIVARELGIPTVVALPGVTRWLADGDRVEVDGGAGTVRRLPPDGAADAG